MQKNLKKTLSFILTLVMVLGIAAPAIPVFADEVASIAELPAAMDGLSIAYPYNTETVKQTGSVPNRFQALTFESARNEVESAQMILTPNFTVNSFELTMNSLKNENGNVIPSWAFEVFVQHYASISGAGNAPYWTTDSWLGGTYMFKPRGGEAGQGASGMFPDALIPQDAAIAAGENTIAAGKNGGIWVNLNVQDAAPGTYTGFATLKINGTAMQIPVSVRVYDVEVPEEVHVQSMFPVWWDQLQAAEGIDLNTSEGFATFRELADSYFDYLVSKRVMPMDAWNITRWDNSFAEYAASYLAVSPEISSYSLNFEKNNDGTLNETALTATLTALIDKNIELAQSGSNADLFQKAYFTLYDEPENANEYAKANSLIAQLDKVKNELASKLDAYPQLKESFLNLKSIITAQHPDDATYDKMWQDVGSTELTGSYIYCPQFQYLNTAAQRAYYANEESVWWYGCCFPTEPFPTYHINSPLIASRATGWMMYDYDIDGMLYSSVNYWSGQNYWTGYTDNGTPGDMMLVYPGSAYGVNGPIGSVRLENIRESFEDYEYLWLLENTFGTDISTYTQGLYEGVIVTGVYDGQTIDPDGDGNTDAVTIHHNNRIAMLSKLEEMNVAANGETEIAPGQEGFVRGEQINTASSITVQMDETVNAQAVTFDYKIISGDKFGFVLMPDWSNFYGYFDFDASGSAYSYDGVSYVALDDGYVRVVIDLNKVTNISGSPSRNIDFVWLNSSHGQAVFYLDNLQVLTEVPEIEIPTEPPTEPEEPVGITYEIATGLQIDVTDDSYEYITFEYQITNNAELSIAFLSPDWGKYYGYYSFNTAGKVWADAGVYCEILDDGYVRVMLKTSELARTNSAENLNNKPETIGLVLVKYGCTATGYIRNMLMADTCSHIYESVVTAPDVGVQGFTTHTCIVCGHSYVDSYVDPIQPEEPQEVFEGGAFQPGTAIELANNQEIATMSFDYKIESGEKLSIAFLPDWSSYYGYFNFTAQGASESYNGIKTEKLANGYIRVFVDMTSITKKTAEPSSVIKLFYVHPSNGNASGVIENVRINKSSMEPSRGTALTPSVSQSIDLDATEEITTISFDYKITSGTKFSLALLPDWSSYFGYYAFISTGPEGNYPGITAEMLEDGYIRITMNLAELTYQTGNPSYVIDFLFINGNYSNAEGYIDNVQYTVGCNHSYDEVVTNPDCENGGYTTYTCSKCGDSYAGNNTEALGHSYDSVVTAPSFTANGYTTHTCANCGNSYVTDEVAAYTFSVPQWNIALADDIRANFHVNVDSRLTDAQITVLVDGAGYRYDLSELSTTAEGYYVVSANVAAAQMTDDITIQVVSGENASEVKSYSIRGYAEYILTTSDDENTKLLVQRMLNYGAAAQTYFVYNTGNMANAGYEMTDVPTIPEAPSGSAATGTVDGISYYGASLLYETRIGVRFYFTVTGDINSYTFSNGAKATYKSGMYYVDVLNINPNEYDNTIELSVTNGTDTLTVGYSPLRYISRKFYGSTDEKLVNLVAQMYQYHKAAELFLGENDDEPEVTYRGEEIQSATNKTILLNNKKALETISFEYKVTNDGHFNLGFMKDWGNFYSYYKFNANGAMENYTGVTTQVLEDGYILVTVDVAALDKVTGAPAGAVEFLYIRGDWSTATGYIDNVNYVVYEPKLVFEGGDFAATTGATFALDNDQAVTRMTFDYSIESGEYFHIALMPDWSSYFGYFKFDANGVVGTYAGIATTKQEDGSIRVYVDLPSVTTIANSPSDVITMLYVRGDWTNASGTISNIRINESAEDAPRGEAISAGVNKTILLNNKDALVTLSFDYNIVDGERFNIALMQDWSNYFGYYKFNATGAAEAYAGVTTEVLEDGYIRVTFDMATLTKVAGAPTNVIDFLLVYGAWTDANGYIDNVQFS